MKEWFYTVTQSMVQLGLRGTELNLYAVLYGYSQKGDGCYYGTRSELMNRCGVSSLRTIDAAIDSLIKKGLLSKISVIKEGHEVVAYSTRSMAEEGVQKLHTLPCKNCTPPHAKIAHMKNKNIKESINTPPIPPALPDVVEYCRQQGFADPEGFADYYLRCQKESGWKKKDGTAITNWKLNVQQWRRYHKNEIFPHEALPHIQATSDDLKAFLR